MSSLRGKITLAYSSLALIVLLLCGIAVFDLLFLERQVREGVAVSDLNKAVLEMRRQEKNLFLYEDPAAWSEADRQAARALEILDAERGPLSEVAAERMLQTPVQMLERYKGLLHRWPQRAVSDPPMEDMIRELGQNISSTVEDLARHERKALADAVRKSRWWLLASVLAIGALVLLVGRLLARAVTAPLRHLESHLMPIAEGRFDHLEAGTPDREFVAFAEAFNRMLRELDSRQRRLLQSEKLASLGTLAAGVAHELNNPLSNISSSCQLLQEELDTADPDRLQVWLRQIDAETERARQIVLALLEYGRPRELDLKAVRLAEIIDNTRMLAGSTVRRHAARLHIDIPDDLRVKADAQRLQQVFINLLQNALDAGADGTNIRITATSCANPQRPLPDGAEVLGEPECRLSEGTPFAEITVEDDGPGIDPADLPHIFDPFFTTREPGHGMGLGLYIVQEIVREHEGCIAVASNPGRGTRITLRLPCEGPAP